jgi:hypothetical protein
MFDFSKLRNAPKKAPPVVPRLVVGVTGHRPHKLHSPGMQDGYDRHNPLRRWCREQMRSILLNLIQTAPETRPDRYVDAAYLSNKLDLIEWRNRPTDNAPIAITGVALGIDQDFCGVCVELGVPFVAFIPFVGQGLRWPAASREVYRKVLDAAAGVRVVSQPPATDEAARRAALDRNAAMAEVCDELIAVWDGSQGGTSHMVRTWDRFNPSCTGRSHRIDPREYPCA